MRRLKGAAPISEFEKVEEVAEKHGQIINVAIARYQRGLRLGGTEGDLCVASARNLIQAMGSHERLLDEDVGLR